MKQKVSNCSVCGVPLDAEHYSHLTSGVKFCKPCFGAKPDRSQDSGRCCENGYFDEPHECMKQPGKVKWHDHAGRPLRAPPLRETVDELHVMNTHLAEIILLLKVLAERSKLIPADRTM